jgi:hypothetical protein
MISRHFPPFPRFRYDPFLIGNNAQFKPCECIYLYIIIFMFSLFIWLVYFETFQCMFAVYPSTEPYSRRFTIISAQKRWTHTLAWFRWPPALLRKSAMTVASGTRLHIHQTMEMWSSSSSFFGSFDHFWSYPLVLFSAVPWWSLAFTRKNTSSLSIRHVD